MTVTAKMRHRVFEEDGWKCVECGSSVDLTIDHKIPRARGGTDQRSNLQTMCAPCNGSKGSELTVPLPGTRATRRRGERWGRCPACSGTSVPNGVVSRAECQPCGNTGRVLYFRRGNRWVTLGGVELRRSGS